MSNSATQNPSNKVGRNSGAGPAGVSEIRPTPAELERGLVPASRRRGWAGALGAGLGALAVIGGASAYAWNRIRQPRTLRARLGRMVGLK